MTSDLKWKCQSCGEALDHDPIGTAAVCESCVTTAIRKKYETDLRDAAERAAKVIREAPYDFVRNQEWLCEHILAELEPTKPAEPDPNDYVSVPPKIIGKITGKFVPAEPVCCKRCNGTGWIRERQDNENSIIGKYQCPDCNGDLAPHNQKPAEPEAVKSLGEIAYFAANPPGTTYHRGWDQSSKQWWRDVAAAVEAEILRRREPQNKRLIAGRDRARVERDEWEKKFHGAMELAKTHLNSLADANVEVIGLTAELAALKSENEGLNQEKIGLANRLWSDQKELAALKSAAVPTSDDPPCLDIDGNALNVGDEVQFALNNTAHVTAISSGRVQIAGGGPFHDPKLFRKVAAPEKVVVPEIVEWTTADWDNLLACLHLWAWGSTEKSALVDAFQMRKQFGKETA